MAGTYEYPRQCRNCGAELVGPWCHACGQSHRHGRLDARALIAEVAEGVLNLDGRVFRTIWGLSTRPGALIRDYLSGRREPYLHPFKYAVGIVALVFLVAEIRRRLRGETPTQDISPDTIQLLVLAMTPAAALYLRVLFARGPEPIEVDGDPGDGGFRWIEHLVVALYATGHGMLLLLVLGKLVAWMGVSVGEAVLGLIWLAWGSFVAVSTYATRWWTTIPRVALVLVLTALTFIASMLALSPDIRAKLVEPAMQKWERERAS